MYIELRSVEENPFSVMAVMEDAYICQEPRDAEMEAFLVTEGSVEVMSPPTMTPGSSISTLSEYQAKENMIAQISA